MPDSTRNVARPYEHMPDRALEALLKEPDKVIGPPAKEKIRAELAIRRGEPSNLVAKQATAQAALPIRLTVPWSALASDNLNDVPFGKEARGKKARYEDAIARFRAAVAEQYHGAPATGPVIVVAEVWVPNNQVRDPANWWKALGDGLKGLVITDDRWQVAPRWTVDVVGIDVDRPRCEITIHAR